MLRNYKSKPEGKSSCLIIMIVTVIIIIVIIFTMLDATCISDQLGTIFWKFLCYAVDDGAV